MQSGIYWGYVGLIEGLVGAHQGRVRRADADDRDRRAGAAFAGATDVDRARSTPT